MPKRTAWIAAFLTVTGAAVGAELWAAFDTSPHTVPWTDLLIDHVPQEITVTAVAVLAAWLPVHFGERYPRRWASGRPTSARRKHVTAVVVAGLTALQAAVTDDRVTSAEWVTIGLSVAAALGVYAIPNAQNPTR